MRCLLWAVSKAQTKTETITSFSASSVLERIFMCSVGWKTRATIRTAEVRKFYELCWTTCAGQPEEAVFVFAIGLLSYARGNISKRTMGREGREQAVIVDRARNPLDVLTDYLEEEGVRLENSALPSAWHIGKTGWSLEQHAHPCLT